MKKIFFAAFLVFICGNIQGQNSPLPQSSQEPPRKSDKPAVDVRSWTIDERYGVADTCAVDTVVISFQDNTPVDNYSIANSWNGNLGSPLQSKIFFDRTEKSYNLFATPYDAYTVNVEDIKFFNTKTPYANLTYRTALPRFEEEDYFKALYSMNFNKYLNVGGLVNLIYGRGQYGNQNTRAVNGGFFGSYSAKRYAFNASMMFNDFRNYENGGMNNIADLYSNEIYSYKLLATKLTNAISTYKSGIFYLNHKYSLGFERERKLPQNDSVLYDFVPVTSFIHTVKFENAKRKYTDTFAGTGSFYTDNYYSADRTKDSTQYQNLKNTLALTLEEKFNTLLKFGLAAFVEYELIHRTIASDSTRFVNNYENNIYAGGTLSKNEGKVIRYNFSGQIAIAGRRIGDFDLKGNLSTSFRVLKDTVSVSVSADFNTVSPNFFTEKYYSNHFQWENNFDKTIDFRLKARLNLQKTGISLGFNLANIKNFIYFGKDAKPAQYDKNLQVMAFDVTANLRLWKFHWDNKLAYQVTSEKKVLPLPDFSVYTNLYFKTSIVKVLIVQIGTSCRYHTAYYGNSYMPATGQFYLQDAFSVGNYPDMNVYANFHLKRIRFYFQYAHFNHGLFGGENFFLMPDYPINPATFQVGFSWNFYN
ncbi:MAG: putative porin [Prevotellaceae bacterium]|jgi:hypothetical protein|nr:putative porin [Prevotellaceae bacterium]